MITCNSVKCLITLNISSKSLKISVCHMAFLSLGVEVPLGG